MLVPVGESDRGIRPSRDARLPAVSVLGAVATLLLLAAAGVVPLRAQQGALHLDAGVSHSQPPSGLDLPSATYGLLGLRLTYGRADAWLSASAYGAKSTTSDVGDWGSLGLSGELWSRSGEGAAVGLGAEGSAFAVGGPTEYRAVTGRLFPQLRYRSGRLEARLRGIGGVGGSEVVTTLSTTTTTAGTGGTTEVVSDLWYYGAEPGARVELGPTAVELRAAYLESEGGIYRRTGLRLTGREAPVRWSAGLRVWDTPRGGEVTGLVSLQISVGGPWGVHGNGGRSDPGPLLQSPPSWRGGFTVSRRLADLTPAPPPPLYEVTGEGARRTVRFRLEAPEAERVVLLGDFSGWEPVEMARRDGVWTATIRARSGVYHFGFRVDGEWHVPETAGGRVSDDWGRVNATLVVPGS